jgi:[protein-PII] uridylyltransferase
MAEDASVSGVLSASSRGVRVRSYLDAQIRELSGLFSTQEGAGQLLSQRYSQAVDELLRRLYASAIENTRREGPMPSVLLAAVGGYGRKLLGWKSDLDVRLLTRGEPERLQPLAEAMLYPLWDAGISIGHQVITPKQVVADAARDLPTATALLDFRPIAGERSLEPILRERAFDNVFEASRLPEFITRLRAEASARHQRLHDSVYLLEPDVKNGAGGLRDLDLGLWAAGARWRTADLGELERLNVLSEREAAEITQAAEFLWTVRNRLHRYAGRRSDRLTFNEQESIARDMGYRNVIGPVPGASEGQLAAAMAEAFMSDYYRRARVITRASEQLLDRALPRLSGRRVLRVDLGHGISTYGNAVTFTDEKQLRESPALALRLFATAIARDIPALSEARDAVARECADPAFASALRASPEAASLFVRLVITTKRSPFRTDSILAELHDVGLLVAMIPEFSPVVGRAHHDVYHVYTVDVHSVAAVDHLRALIRGELDDVQPLATRLSSQMTRYEVLFMATLLHDIGKAVRGKEHAQRGAEMSRTILARLSFPEDHVEEACALVREHLTMYLVAMRRDVDDPQTIAEFARKLRGRQRLRTLYLLTVADLCTTSPTSMTHWKSSMLESLFRATDSVFDGDSPGDPRRLKHMREDAARYWEDGLDPLFLDEFCKTMPARYLLSNSSEEIAAHAKVALQVSGEPVTAALVPSRHADVAELCVVTQGRPAGESGLCVVAGDRPGLLAAITAALAANRLDIHAAQIHSRQLTDGSQQAVDLFWVRHPVEGAAGVELALPKLQRDLRSVIRGRVQPRDLLPVRKPSRWSERPTPSVSTEVTIDQSASPQHSVIEVLTRDKAGVLFTIAQALHDLGLSIALAKVSTEGNRAADVFYVTETDGTKPEGEARIAEVRLALMAALEPHLVQRLA